MQTHTRRAWSHPGADATGLPVSTAVHGHLTICRSPRGPSPGSRRLAQRPRSDYCSGRGALLILPRFLPLEALFEALHGGAVAGAKPYMLTASSMQKLP